MAVTVNDEIAEPVVLPTDDDRLAAALAELDSKLTAWSGAIAHAQSSVIHLLSNQKDHTAPAPPAKIHVIAETPFHPTEKPATPTPDPLVTDKPTAGSTTGANPQEDEALLATLDPEVRKKVQILRRLSGNSKSVRELVEKHNLTAGTPAPPPPGKKTFWRR